MERPIVKPYRPANPAVWGAVLAIAAGLIVFFGQWVGASHPDNTLLATPAKAAGAGWWAPMAFAAIDGEEVTAVFEPPREPIWRGGPPS